MKAVHAECTAFISPILRKKITSPYCRELRFRRVSVADGSFQLILLFSALSQLWPWEEPFACKPQAFLGFRMLMDLLLNGCPYPSGLGFA